MKDAHNGLLFLRKDEVCSQIAPGKNSLTSVFKAINIPGSNGFCGSET